MFRMDFLILGWILHLNSSAQHLSNAFLRAQQCALTTELMAFPNGHGADLLLLSPVHRACRYRVFGGAAVVMRGPLEAQGLFWW